MKRYIKAIIVILLVSALFSCATPKMNLSLTLDTEIFVEEDKALVYPQIPK